MDNSTATYGFTRYPFPGEAHNDYWKDDQVFGHFIDDVILKKHRSESPNTLTRAVLVSRILPYILCLALLTAGVYVLYKTTTSIFFKGVRVSILLDVVGITALVAGSTVLSRMPRLDKLWPGLPIGLAALAAGVAGMVFFAPGAQQTLSSAFHLPFGLLWFFLVASLLSALLGKLKPKLGMAPLITFGGLAAFLALLEFLPRNPTALDQSLWVLVLANAAFLYLWWLAALLFDLVYIWHRYICFYGTTSKILQTLRERHKAAPSV